MKTVMITGANSGLGFETARKVAGRGGYAVILACRNPEKAEAARRAIVAETGNRHVSVQILDTSSLASVRKCAADMRAAGIRLDALVCNAGISPRHGGSTEEGFDLVFATNYLGHFLLVMELLPTMDSRARIIPVTSDMHDPPMGIAWKGADYLAFRAGDDMRRYSYSKLCAVLFTYRLDAELRRVGSDIAVNCFNPGFMADTNFMGGHGSAAHTLMVKTTMPERYGTLEGSSTALAALVTDARYDGVSGHYIDRTFGIGESSALSHDARVQDELWTKSQEYTGVDARAILEKLG